MSRPRSMPIANTHTPMNTELPIPTAPMASAPRRPTISVSTIPIATHPSSAKTTGMARANMGANSVRSRVNGRVTGSLSGLRRRSAGGTADFGHEATAITEENLSPFPRPLGVSMRIRSHRAQALVVAFGARRPGLGPKPEATSLLGRPLGPTPPAAETEEDARRQPGARGNRVQGEAGRCRRDHLAGTADSVSREIPRRDSGVHDRHRETSDRREHVPPPRPSLSHGPRARSCGHGPDEGRRSHREPPRRSRAGRSAECAQHPDQHPQFERLLPSRPRPLHPGQLRAFARGVAALHDILEEPRHDRGDVALAVHDAAADGAERRGRQGPREDHARDERDRERARTTSCCSCTRGCSGRTRCWRQWRRADSTPSRSATASPTGISTKGG